MSQAAGPISKIGCSPLIIAAAVAVVAAIVGGFFLFASPSTEESSDEGLTYSEDFDPCQMPDSENEWWQEEVYGCFDPWPFTVTEGSIIGFVGDAGCEVVLMAQAPDDSVFISYAVNDVAVGIAEAGVFDHADIDLIRKSAGEIGPFVEAGLSLCENFQSSKPIDGEGRTRGSDDESAMD